VLSFVAGLLAGPVFGLDPTRSGNADAAPAEVVVASTPAAAPVRASTSPTATPSATPTACKGATDTRRTTKARAEPFTVCGVALINRNHKVTAAYSPKLVTVHVRASGVPSVKLQPTAATALVEFFAAAKAAGYTPVVRSSYRSYATQATWYATMSHALTAQPGASEHQSGLAVDLAGIERGRLVRGTALAGSRTGAWLLKNAATYGFILRYPTSESAITGIAYEPWHFRYVGVKVAKGVNATKTKTLERYLEVN
jgi:D-alanyl-D-alanine carboxypeptidase